MAKANHPPLTLPQASRADMWEWCKNHPGAAGSSLLVLYTTVKVLLVSRGNAGTAAGLVEAAGPTQILVGALIAVYPVVATSLYLRALRWSSTASNDAILAPFVFVLSHVLVMSTVPVYLFVAMLGAVTLFEIVNAFRRWKQGADGKRRHRIRGIGPSLAVLTLIGLITPALSDQMWLPAETVEVRGVTTLAYVIGADSDWTTLLEHTSRRLVRARTDEVKSRKMCALPPRFFSDRTLADHIMGRKVGYPACPMKPPSIPS